MAAASWVLSLWLVPGRQWKKLWPAGLIGMTVLYAIDSTLAGLGAFTFNQGSLYLSGVPVFYLLSSFAGGILAVHYYPSPKGWRLPYILLIALLLLLAEAVMIRFGFFQHLKWSIERSLLLNVLGFTVMIWLSRWTIPAVTERHNR